MAPPPLDFAAGGQPINSLMLALARGQITDVEYVHKFGNNQAVGIGTAEIITSAGGTYPWPTTKEAVRVKAGGDAADAIGGVGVRKVLVLGLSDWVLAEEEIELAGASASASTTTEFERVYRAYATEVGAYGVANTGLITIENDASTQVLATIGVGMGQTQMALFTIPEGKQGMLFAWQFDIDAAQDVDCRLYQRNNADLVAAPFGAKRLITQYPEVRGIVSSNGQIAPVILDEKTDIWAEATGGVAASVVSAEFDLLLWDKES